MNTEQYQYAKVFMVKPPLVKPAEERGERDSRDGPRANFPSMEISEKPGRQIRKWAKGMRIQFTEKGNTNGF